MYVPESLYMVLLFHEYEPLHHQHPDESQVDSHQHPICNYKNKAENLIGQFPKFELILLLSKVQYTTVPALTTLLFDLIKYIYK